MRLEGILRKRRKKRMLIKFEEFVFPVDQRTYCCCITAFERRV